MRTLLLGLLLIVSGCATQFVGDAHYPGGAGQCFQDCQQQRMVMAAFVTMGEYSSGCVCAPAAQGAQTSAAAVIDPASAAASAMPAVVGVELARRARDDDSSIVR